MLKSKVFFKLAIPSVFSLFVLPACGNLIVGVSSNAASSASHSSFTQNWLMNSASPYSYNTSLIQFSGGTAALISNSHSDLNSSLFNQGTFTGGGLYDSTNSYLRLSTSSPNTALDASWTPAWSNLVGYWKLDETGGASSISDSSPSGTLTGTASNITFGGTGKIGTGALFNGTSSSIDLGTPASLRSLSTFTMSAWIKITSVGGGTYTIIGQEFGGKLRLSGSALSLPLSTNGSSWASTCLSSTSLSAGNWYYVSGTYDGSSIRLYIDGVLNTTCSQTGVVGTNSNHNMIGSIAAADYFNGRIDEAAVWNTALNASAIATLYQHQSAQYTGTLTSRVMDGLASGQSWTSLAWVPTLPFSKPLPDNTTSTPASESTSSYASLNSGSLMSGIVGLWHLDEASGTSGAGSVLDRSGNGNNGTPTSVIFGGAGKLGSSASFDGSTSHLDVSSSSSLNSINNYVSVSAWVYFNQWYLGACEKNLIVSRDVDYVTSGFYGLFVIDSGAGCSPSGIKYPNFRVSLGGVSGPAVTGATQLSLATWYHLLGTYDGSTLKIYLNGKLDNSASYSGVIGSTSSNLTIGYMNYAGYNFNVNGLIDEVAIWSRALSSAEILQIYRRGANRIKYQVQTCSSSASCSSSPNWKGPDGTNQTYFSELNNNSIPNDGADLTSSDSVLAGLPSLLFSSFSSLSVSANRYFQYRAILESDDNNNLCNYGSGAAPCSPELTSVTVGPTHYDTSIPTITNLASVSYNSLSSVSETLGSNGCSSGVKYQLSPDNSNWYYWTGAAWALSNNVSGTTGYSTASSAQALTTAAMQAFSTQITPVSGNLYFKAFLKSDGSHACELNEFTIAGLN